MDLAATMGRLAHRMKEAGCEGGALVGVYGLGFVDGDRVASCVLIDGVKDLNDAQVIECLEQVAGELAREIEKRRRLA